MTDQGDLEHRQLLREIVHYLIRDCPACEGSGGLSKLSKETGEWEPTSCYQCSPIRILLGLGKKDEHGSS